MLKLLLIPIGFISLVTSCQLDRRTTIIDPQYFVILDGLAQQPQNSLMTQAYLQEKSLRSSLSQKTLPVTVVIFRDDALLPYLASKNLSQQDFLAHPRLIPFLKSHILNEALKGDGVYTSSSGAKWTVKMQNSTQPASINGVLVAGCSDALVSPDAGAFYDGQTCFVDAPIVPLE